MEIAKPLRSQSDEEAGAGKDSKGAVEMSKVLGSSSSEWVSQVKLSRGALTIPACYSCYLRQG